MLVMKPAALIRCLALGILLPSLAACNGAANTPTETTAASEARFNVMNRPLAIVNDTVNSSSTVSAMAVTAPTLTLVATVTPPLVNGVRLQANAMTSSTNNIFVSYNLAGAAAGGGIDEIDVTIPAAPVLNSSLQFPTLDVNNVHVIGSALYVAGNSSVEDQPARVQKYAITLLGSIGALLGDVGLPGYATTGFGHDLLGTKLFTLTGDNGGLQVVNPTDLTAGAAQAVDDARDISVAPSGKVYVVSGNGTHGAGQVASFDANGLPLGTLSLGDTGAAQSKSTIQAGLNYAVATAGSGGVRMICLDAMQAVASIAAPTGGVTNAAVFVGGFVFTADGANGVSVYSVDAGLPLVGYLNCKNTTLTRLGSINFGTSVSANNIGVYGGYLVVSGGLGGFQLIRLTLPGLLTGVVTSL